eukprot:5839773-Pleurochrysis_carterae.AAC.2
MRLSSNIAAAGTVAENAFSPRCKPCNRRDHAVCQPATDRVAMFCKGAMQDHSVRNTCWSLMICLPGAHRRIRACGHEGKRDTFKLRGQVVRACLHCLRASPICCDGAEPAACGIAERDT